MSHRLAAASQRISQLAAGSAAGRLLQRQCACGQHTALEKCEGCAKQKGGLQRKSQDRRGGEVPPIVHEVLRSPGRPLDTAMRAFMEPRFEHDFSRVRVHDDAHATRSVHAVSAEAFTVGHDVVFGDGRYAPNSASGRKLLAHELAHVVQQDQASSTTIGFIDDSDDRHEVAADHAATAVLGGRHSQVRALNLPHSVQRKPTEPNTPPGSQPGVQPQDMREQIIALAESGDAADRQHALDLIVSTYYQRPANFGGIVYDPNHKSTSPQDADTGPSPGQPEFGGEQRIVIGPRFFRHFRGRYDQRVRTIGHELQHIGQRSPPSGRTVASTLGGIGLGAAIGGVLGLAGIGIAAAAHASLSTGLVGGVIGAAAGVGGLIGGIADPFGHSEEPIRNRNTREFLAIHWVLTAPVRGIERLPPGQALLNINQPKEGALDRYNNMPPEDQKRYRRQYEEILDIKRRLEREKRQEPMGDYPGPEAPAPRSDVNVA